MNINNNKHKDVSDLKSFDAKFKQICRLQMVFYLEIIKFNLYGVHMPRWRRDQSVAFLSEYPGFK